MNLAELVAVVAVEVGQSKAATREVIKTTLDIIQREVKRNGRVSVVGFGAFFSTVRKGRTGRNPQTGEFVKIPTTAVPKFKAGKYFRDLVRHTHRKAK